MAISRTRKEELVAEYRQQWEQSSGLVLADYTALTVAQMQELRRSARENDGLVFVVKNTLLNLVLKEQGLEPPEDLFVGPTIVVFCHEDVPPLAKLFVDFEKEREEGKFKVKGSILEGRYLAADDTKAIANLPSREVLLAQVLRTINAPATQTAGVVAGGIRQVLNVVKAYVDKLEEANGASAEAAA